MKLPQEVTDVLEKLEAAGFQAHIVGGCVRDILSGRAPQDWDVTTNAVPAEIQKIFPESFYENSFGTVTVKTGSEDLILAQIQVTPYRKEAKYTDKRHPEEIVFASQLEDDLSRRDFTVNALAMDKEGKLTDLFEGQKDLDEKIIRTVGNPEERFGEDALRLLRAVRLATVLNFTIEEKTLEAIKNSGHWLKAISQERIRDEFVKMIESDRAYEGVLLLLETKLLEHVIPELLEGVEVGQNLHHIYTVWEHNVRALKYTVDKKYPLHVRLAALLHDVGKPRTKRGDGKYSTFYGHDVVGARMTLKIMERLRFSKELTEKVVRLVRYHLFYYNVGEVTEASVRRLLAKVEPENIEDLMRVREADRIGSGTPKAVPYKLRHLKYVIDKVSHDPISVKMLAVKGDDVMKELDIQPGPKIGLILNSLLVEVLDDPIKNTKEHLQKRIHELNKRTPEELRESLKKIEEAVEQEEKERMKKY
ncbi:MAG: HD domain-containing protein, partial [Candidatus Yanofskybacteria bacterium]|nr:HD domain-containing protein [Candidatus Yanofskybacteria bacterium]